MFDIPTSTDGIEITEYPDGSYVAIEKAYVGLKYMVIQVQEVSPGNCKYRSVALFDNTDDAEWFAELKNLSDNQLDDLKKFMDELE